MNDIEARFYKGIEMISDKRIVQGEISLPDFFNLKITMDSDQCPALRMFWKRESEKTYYRAYEIDKRYYLVKIKQKRKKLMITAIPEENQLICKDPWTQIENKIRYQFRLDDDDGQILKQVETWPKISGLFYQFPGLRTMRNADIFECVCSSICSQNTSINILNKMIDKLSNHFGKKIAFADGSEARMLPSADLISQLEISELMKCGLGYRAKYLLNSSKLLMTSNYKYSQIVNLSKFDAEKAISYLPGVGPKVGALILSFGFGRTDVFAVDVWVKKCMGNLFGWKGSSDSIKRKAEDLFGNCASYVNTYCFYIYRKGLLNDN